MPSLRFPDSGTRMVLTGSGRPALNARGYLYADDTLTTPAEVYRDVNGVKGALIGVDAEGRRYVDLDAYGEQPDYWGPDSGATRLWIVVNGVASAVHADYGRRIDTLTAQVGGAETPAQAQAKADAAAEYARQRANHTGTQSADTLVDGTNVKAFTAAERTKLSGVAAGATANSADSALRDRSTHTGTQPTSTITGLDTALAGKAPTANPTFTGTVTGVTKAHVGLPNVDDTSDVNKPVSTAQLAAIETFGVRANDPRFGTPGTRAAFINALDAAEAKGNNSIVYIPAGMTVDVGAGLSMSGRTVQIVGAGAGLSGLTPKASVIRASTQTGPVLDYSGYVAPSNFMGKITPLSGVLIVGSNVSDPTKNNAGIRILYMQSATFRDIAIMNTGGPCLELARNPGAGAYLCDFERIIMSTPVNAKANDVPYFYANEPNGNRFRGLGLRSILSSGDVGASGAAVVESNDQFASRYNLFDGWWYEFLHPSAGSTLFHHQGNQNVIRDFQWWDIREEAAAAGTGTSYIRLVPPIIGDLGGNEIYGTIPGDQNVSNWIDTGIDVRQSRNRIVGTKGYRAKNVTLAAGVDYTYVQLGGAESGGAGSPPAFVNNSAATHNTLIDDVNGDAYRNGVQVRKAGLDVTGSPTTYYTTGRYYTTPAAARTTAVIPNGDGSLCGAPFFVGQPRGFDRIGVEVTTAAAATNVRLGIYADTGGGLPGALVLDAGTVDASTTGTKELTISTGLLAPGEYWLAAVAQGGSPTFRALSGSAWPIGITTLAAATASVVYAGGCTAAAAVTGALPSTFPTINNFTVSPPVIALRAT
ncbi:hypothetical protein ABZ949_02335 [Micromonospora tulbaghiae]|uniref:hypothetical protein n=1 Tax=Micromonospora tulbaghiae TaxID=479978 RepID=UPI0033DF61EC